LSDASQRARTILALDAAGSSCSAALFASGKIQAQAREAMGRGQSERLVPMIQEVTAAAGCAFADLDAIAVTCGPGGFTGVRIGLAAARGLALALGLPTVGLSNFEVLASAVPAPDRHLVVAIDAKRAEVYVQIFAPSPEGGAPRPLGPGYAARPDALAAQAPLGPLVLIGDAAEAASTALRSAGRNFELVPSEDLCLAALAAELAAARPLPDAGAPPPRPIYLRGADVTLPDGRKAQAVP
jgi:tRNA threonylcarbamoyladenosine biosynthesis protein TsaB